MESLIKNTDDLEVRCPPLNARILRQSNPRTAVLRDLAKAGTLTRITHIPSGMVETKEHSESGSSRERRVAGADVDSTTKDL